MVATAKGEAGAALTIAPLPLANAARAFPLLKALRPHLTEALFERRIAALEGLGYELFVAFREGDLVGVVGGRPVATLSKGRHFFVDDLFVSPSNRGEDIGAALMDHVETRSRTAGMAAVVLNARPVALGFYAKRGYGEASSPMMIKELD